MIRIIKDLFLDIGSEELSHMEMVAQTINLLNGHDVNYESVGVGEIQSHVLGRFSTSFNKCIRSSMDSRLCNCYWGFSCRSTF